jgi:hypothetical protein
MLVEYVNIPRLRFLPNGFGFGFKDMIQTWVLGRLKPGIRIQEYDTSFFSKFQQESFGCPKVMFSVLKSGIEDGDVNIGLNGAHCP